MSSLPKGICWTIPQLFTTLEEILDEDKKRRAIQSSGGDVASGFLGVLLLFYALSVALIVYTVYLLVKHYKEMPAWALVLAAICLLVPDFEGGVLIALGLALFARK
jgi:hypothetical protein